MVKCMAYDDPAFDPPCPIDDPFAVWAGVLWRLELGNERIAELHTLYLDTSELLRDDLFRQMREAFLKVVQGRNG